MVVLRRSKRIANKKYASESADSNFISTLSDDLLLEILIRLPRLGPAITVCKNWYSLIISDHPNTFHRHILHHHHRQQNHNPDPSYTLPYTLLLGYDLTKPCIQVLSEKSKILRTILSKQLPNYKTFLGFVSNMNPLAIKALFNDSLLIHLNGQYYICNPITQEQRLLPDPPSVVPEFPFVKFMLVGSEEPNGFRFRVVIFPLGQEANSKRIMVFSSETGQWNESVLKNFPKNCWNHMVATNRALMWLQRSDGVCVYEPFKQADDPDSCRLVNFPAKFVCLSSQDLCKKTLRFGSVRGRFRLSRILFVEKDSSFRLRIWELNNGNDEWILVHEVFLKREIKGEIVSVVAFHPGDGDVIFVSRGLVIYRCDLKDGEVERYRKVAEVSVEIPKRVKVFHLNLWVFTLVHSWC